MHGSFVSSTTHEATQKKPSPLERRHNSMRDFGLKKPSCASLDLGMGVWGGSVVGKPYDGVRLSW
jgi:hypothetical protein